MNLDQEHKNKVGKMLTLRLVQALKNNEISSIHLPVVSQEILDNLDMVQTEEELIEFLKKLNDEWEFFSEIVEIEQGTEIAEHEQEKIEEIQQLLRTNKVDEALEKVNQLS